MSRAQFIGLAIIMVISSFAGGATVAWLMKPEAREKRVTADELSVDKINVKKEIVLGDEKEHASISGWGLRVGDESGFVEISREGLHVQEYNKKLKTDSFLVLGIFGASWGDGGSGVRTLIYPGGIHVLSETTSTKVGVESPITNVINNDINAASIVMYDKEDNELWSAP